VTRCALNCTTAPGAAEWLTGASLRGCRVAGWLGGLWGVQAQWGCVPCGVLVVTVVQFAADRCDAAGDRRPGRQSRRAASGRAAPLADLPEQAIDGLPQHGRQRIRNLPERRLAYKGQQPIPRSHSHGRTRGVDLRVECGQAERVLDRCVELISRGPQRVERGLVGERQDGRDGPLANHSTKTWSYYGRQTDDR
jgi:hypothetical protein